MKSNPTSQHKMLIDVAMVLAAVVLMVATTATAGVAVPGRHRPPSVFLGFYSIYLGVLFLLSFFYSRASYVLTALMWICQNFSHPRGRFMALFYFGLLAVVGTITLLAAFEIL